MTGRLRNLGVSIALPVLLIGGWWLGTRGSTSFWVPRPGQLAQVFSEVWLSQRLVDDVLPSLGRLALGLGLAVALGIGLGLLIGSSTVLRHLTEPVLELLRAIPPPVLVPVLIILIGVDSTMNIAVIAAGCIWPVLLNTIEGVRATDDVVDQTARSFGITERDRLLRVTLPAASPFIVTGVRQALSLGLILMVISEMFAATSGIGFAIVQFQRSFAVPGMWSGIVLLGIIGVILATAFRWAERRILSWYYGFKEVEHGE